MFRSTCLAFVAVGLLHGLIHAEDAPKIKQPPWHLVDIWWDTGKDWPFESYSIEATLHEAVPADVRLYIAPIGIAHLEKTPFYGGLQTQSDGNTKQDRRLRKLGPGLLMSMWGQRSLDAIRPSLGGFCQSSGHEGDFVSVRRPYAWAPGRYTYRVVRMDKELVENKPYTWVGAFVYCHAKDENVFIGALRFPGENLTLGRKLASFVEIYGPAIPIQNIPKATITFGNLRVNGLPVENVRASAHYPPEVPARANTTAQRGLLEVRIGEPAPANRPNRVQLLPAK